jgi:hypothetical protein
MHGNNNISLSQIEQHVLRACNMLNITNLQNVSLGLYACEEVTNKYINRYVQGNMPSDINDKLYSLRPPNILTSSYIQQPHISYFSLFRIIIEDDLMKERIKTKWGALAGLTHQGCALNVLSFYGILSEPRARERAVCLTLKGTSIFSIITYIDHYNINNLGNYAVARLGLSSGIDLIYKFITQYTPQGESYAIIFKIYDDDTIKNTSKYSEIGHTISVCFDSHTKNVWFIDPQAGIYEQLNPQYPNQLYSIITTNFPSKKFIDLILDGDYENNFTNQPTFTFNQLVEAVQQGIIKIRDVPKDMYYGGKKRAVKTKKNTRSRMSRK